MRSPSAVTLSDAALARVGQPVTISCADFVRPRAGTVVAAGAGGAHVAFGPLDRIEPDLFDRLALAGSTIIIEKAKSDHRAFVQSVRNVIEGRAQMKASDLANHHTCRLGKWYDRVIDPQILANPAYVALAEPHKRVHQSGKDALSLFHSGDRHGATRALERLVSSSEEVLALLEQMGREAAAR